MPRDADWYAHLQVQTAKVVDYLMSATNEDGRHKRSFFVAHGFIDSGHQQLIDALLSHAESAVEVADTTSIHGRKWILRGRLHCPDGREPTVQVVWMQHPGQSAIRLITAYPVRGDRR